MDTSGKGGVLRHTVGLVDPQGVRITSFKAPTEEELRARLPLADPEGAARPRATSGSSTARHYEDVLIVRVRELAPSRRRSSGATTRSTTSRPRLVDGGHHDHQVHAAHLGRRAEGAAAGPARRPDQALEVQPRRHRRARPAGRPTARPTRSPSSAPTPRSRRGTSSRATSKWYRNLAIGELLLDDPAPAGPAVAGRRLRRRGAEAPAGRRGPGRRDPHRRGHPLRHAAARGRQPARDRRGRRPRHLRLQVPRRRPGGPGAGRRGDRRAGWPERIGLRTPRLVGARPRPRRSPATRPTRRSRTCSTPAPGSTSASTSCPARSGSTADVPAGRRGASAAARVLWLDAFVANVDRSWRNPNLLLWHGDLWVIDHGAALYFHHGWAGGVDRPGAVRRTSPGARTTTCSATHAAELPGVDAELRGCLDESVFAEVLAEVPDAWLEPVPGADDPEAVRAAYVDFLTARLGTAPVAAAGSGMTTPSELSWPTSTSCCAASRAWTARSSSTSAWCCTARWPTSSTSPGTSTATGCGPRPAGRRRPGLRGPGLRRRRLRRRPDRVVRPPPSPSTQRFGFLKAPAQHRPPARPGPRRRHRRPRPPARTPPRTARRLVVVDPAQTCEPGQR